MNFLGRSLIDVSGVTVVCSPFFSATTGRADVDVTARPLIPGRSQADLQRDLETGLRSLQSRAREKGRVSKFSLSRKLITECRLVEEEEEAEEEMVGWLFPR